MYLESDVHYLKLTLGLLILSTYVDAGRLDDDYCAIRFYAVRHFQGDYWTFDGNLWTYGENGHKYTEKSDIPDRNSFVAKSIRTLANKPEKCNRWKICSKKYKRKNFCKILPLGVKKYPDITRLKIGKHKMKQWRISIMNKRTSHVCMGNNCNSNISEYPKPMAVKNNDEILLHPSPEDVSPLKDSSRLFDINIMHSVRNNTFIPEKEAPETKSAQIQKVVFYFLVVMITLIAINAFIAGTGLFSCIMLYRKKYKQRMGKFDSAIFVEQNDSYELLVNNNYA